MQGKIDTMKYLYLCCLAILAVSCVANEETGEMEAGWLFWVMLGIIVFCLVAGVMVSTLRKNKNDDSPSRSESQIEGYEKALEEKEKAFESEKSDESDKSDKTDKTVK